MNPCDQSSRDSFNLSFACFAVFPLNVNMPRSPLTINNLAPVTSESFTEKTVVTPPVCLNNHIGKIN